MARTTTALKVVVEWNLWAAIVVDLHLPPIPTTVALFVPIVWSQHIAAVGVRLCLYRERDGGFSTDDDALYSMSLTWMPPAGVIKSCCVMLICWRERC